MFLITAKQHFLDFIEAKWSLVCHVLDKSALQHTPDPRDTAGSLGLQLPHKDMLSHCEIRLPVGGWPEHAHRHIRGLQLLGIYLESSSAPLGSSGGSVRYAGEAANAPGGREEEVAESDTTTWSQWGYRRIMIKAKAVHGRQTHVCVEKTHGTARVGDFSFPET